MDLVKDLPDQSFAAIDQICMMKLPEINVDVDYCYLFVYIFFSLNQRAKYYLNYLSFFSMLKSIVNESDFFKAILQH